MGAAGPAPAMAESRHLGHLEPGHLGRAAQGLHGWPQAGLPRLHPLPQFPACVSRCLVAPPGATPALFHPGQHPDLSGLIYTLLASPTAVLSDSTWGHLAPPPGTPCLATQGSMGARQTWVEHLPCSRCCTPQGSRARLPFLGERNLSQGI